MGKLNNEKIKEEEKIKGTRREEERNGGKWREEVEEGDPGYWLPLESHTGFSGVWDREKRHFFVFVFVFIHLYLT
jgi:hypothetical protein